MPLVILIGIVIVIGVVIVFRSGAGQSTTGVQLQDGSLSVGRDVTPGVGSFVFGVVAALGVATIGLLTFDWVPGFDWPEWLRIVTAWMFPVGLVGSVILGALALKRDAGRAFGIVGIGLAGLSMIAFVAMLFLSGY